MEATKQTKKLEGPQPLKEGKNAKWCHMYPFFYGGTLQPSDKDIGAKQKASSSPGWGDRCHSSGTDKEAGNCEWRVPKFATDSPNLLTAGLVQAQKLTEKLTEQPQLEDELLSRPSSSCRVLGEAHPLQARGKHFGVLDKFQKHQTGNKRHTLPHTTSKGRPSSPALNRNRIHSLCQPKAISPLLEENNIIQSLCR